MTYNSPFDVTLAGSGLSLEYSGTLEEILSEVAAASSHQSAPSAPQERLEDMLSRASADARRWALHPPRIIRAVVDYKIQHPDSPEIEELLGEAIGVALGAYSDLHASSDAVGRLRGLIESTGHAGLLTMPLTQVRDGVTSDATDPLRSQMTAERLRSQMQSKDVLFIALAHGGVAAGMDVYLRYCDASGSQDSAFYVARLSTQKKGDKQPQLTQGEMKYLRELAQGRQVVVFDEDSYSGRTLDIARDYFSSQVFPSQGVIAVTNLDARHELEYLGFGKEMGAIEEFIMPEKKHLAIKELYEKSSLKKIIDKSELEEKNEWTKNIIYNQDFSEGKLEREIPFRSPGLYSSLCRELSLEEAYSSKWPAAPHKEPCHAPAEP